VICVKRLEIAHVLRIRFLALMSSAEIVILCRRVESVVESRDGRDVDHVPFRDHMYVAKAPQSFCFGDIYKLYEKALSEGWKSIDSAHLCHRYGFPMHLVKSPRHNMKITDPLDYYMCCAIFDVKEREALWER